MGFRLVCAALNHTSETTVEPVMRQKVQGSNKNLNEVGDDLLILGCLDIGIEATLDSDEDGIEFFGR